MAARRSWASQEGHSSQWAATRQGVSQTHIESRKKRLTSQDIACLAAINILAHGCAAGKSKTFGLMCNYATCSLSDLLIKHTMRFSRPTFPRSNKAKSESLPVGIGPILTHCMKRNMDTSCVHFSVLLSRTFPVTWYNILWRNGWNFG